MQRITLARLVLSLVLVGALALAGCGGSDGVSQSLHDQTVAEKDAAEKKAAEEEAARLAAEKKAAEEEAARLAAEKKAAEEEAARLAAEKKKAAEEEAKRQRMAAINAAQMTLSGAEDALMALGEDATDEARRDAQRMVEAAANTLRDVLRMNGGSTADIDAAIGKAVTAKNAAGALQAMITARADAATAAQMEAINTAQMTLSDAEAALMALAEDATDEAKRDAQRAVGMAAAALVQALTDNDGTADQIAAATMKQESAKMMADGLQATITAAADTAEAAQMLAAQRKAIADAIMATQMAVNAVNNDSTDDEIAAAGVEITKVTAAIAAATDVPDSEKAANTATVNALMAQLDGAKASRMAAMDAAAVAQRMAAINTAKDYLAEKEMALAALPDNATDEQMRDAQRLVEAAANNLRDVLQMNDGSAADIEAAVRKAQTAKVAADALQATITAAADAAKQLRMTAINTAQMELSDAEDALVMLDDDATDKEQRNAQRGVERAAADLLQVLMDNDGTAEQIQAATMKRDSAKMMADDLTPQVDIDDQRMAITNAAAAAATAVAAVDNDATDTEVKAADDAIADLEQAIADATDLPDTETAPWKRVLTAHETSLATNKKSRQMAMDEADEEERNKQRIADNAAGLLVADAIVRKVADGGHDASADVTGGAAALELPASLMSDSLMTEVKKGATAPTIELRRSTGVKLTAMNTMSPGDGWTAKRFEFDKNRGVVVTNLGASTVKVARFSYDVFFDVAGTGASTMLAGVTPGIGGLLTFATGDAMPSHFAVTGLLPSRPTGAAVTTTAPTAPTTHSGSFLGVRGQFTCTACTVMRDKDDVLDIRRNVDLHAYSGGQPESC